MNKRWTMAEKKLLGTLMHLTDKEISQRIPGTTAATIASARRRFDLLKPIETGRFKPGQTSWNKGKNYNAGGKSVETRFKKGQPPPTAFRKIGDVFTIPDKTGKIYKFIKLGHHRQYPYGRYVWEQTTGEMLTSNELITFRDGNPQNCSIDNLQKITKAENALRNNNRKKGAQSLKITWGVVKTYEDFGMKPPYKFKSKRKN